MEVELTARQGKISRALRTRPRKGWSELGEFWARPPGQHHVRRAEASADSGMTVQARLQTIAATARRIPWTRRCGRRWITQRTARRYRDRRLEGKRLPKEEKVLREPPVVRPKVRPAQTELPRQRAGRPRRKVPRVDRCSLLPFPRRCG